MLPRFYPGLYEDFLSVLPQEERAQPIDAYFRRILDPDPAVHGPAARAWGQTERILSEHAPNRSRLDLPALESSRALPATPFMEAHYFANDSFMQPDQLMNEAGKLTGIPGIIVQGRYDLLCPPATSHALAARMARGRNPRRRRRRPHAVRSRRPRRRDEGRCGHGVREI